MDVVNGLKAGANLFLALIFLGAAVSGGHWALWFLFALNVLLFIGFAYLALHPGSQKAEDKRR